VQWLDVRCLVAGGEVEDELVDARVAVLVEAVGDGGSGCQPSP
jgi:hypothetical protein